MIAIKRDLKLENWLLESNPCPRSSDPLRVCDHIHVYSVENDMNDCCGCSSNIYLKLIDFGLSRHFEDSETLKQVVGSTLYVAPEVLKGTCMLSHLADHATLLNCVIDTEKCDVWSMGIIAFMMVSGELPFGSSSSKYLTPGSGSKLSKQAIEEMQKAILDGKYRDLPYFVSKQCKDFVYNLLNVDDEVGFYRLWRRLMALTQNQIETILCKRCIGPSLAE